MFAGHEGTRLMMTDKLHDPGYEHHVLRTRDGACHVFASVKLSAGTYELAEDAKHTGECEVFHGTLAEVLRRNGRAEPNCWKVVFPMGRTFCSMTMANCDGGVTYAVGEPTRAPEGQGPLAVFESEETAQAFVTPHSGYAVAPAYGENLREPPTTGRCCGHRASATSVGDGR